MKIDQRLGSSTERQRPEVVTRDITVTSEKIRRLAKAGYSRVEISKFLGIRYQHVRNVLLQAGITSDRESGVERSPILVASEPSNTIQTSWDALLRAGFRHLGEWTLSRDGMLSLDTDAPPDPGVYALVLNDVVVYVGLTLASLRTRMDQYRRGHKGQRTSARVNGLIAASLRKGNRVRVLVATPEPLQWNGLPVNTAAGLEAALIQMFRPSWNVHGTS